MTTESEYLAERARRVPAVCATAPYQPQPDRTEVPVSRLEAFNAALEFVRDCTSPEGYGHLLPPEMIRRCARILAMLRPKEPGIGYMEPPPARCQVCDET